MPLLSLLIMALLQWYICFMVDEPSFDYTAFLYGNLQIVAVLWVYQTVTKYIKLN